MQQRQLEELTTEMTQCALIILTIEQQTEKCGFGPSSEYKFLKRWLSDAYKSAFQKKSLSHLQRSSK